MSKKRSFKSAWADIRLRGALFRIWFMKNILLWIQIFCIVCLICTLTGQITASTPILGKIIYPIFSPIVDKICDVIETKDIGNLMEFFSIIISMLLSVGMFTMKAKSIAQTDIKSNKLKMALISANLYFNSDGRLVQKVEKMTGQDLDGDGKIDSQEVQIVNKGLISGFFSAIKEFFTIATADFSKNEIDAYEKTLKDADLEDASEGLDEIVKLVKTTTKSVLDDKVGSDDGIKKKSIAHKIIEKIFGKKKKEDDNETENKIDVVINTDKNEDIDNNEIKDIEIIDSKENVEQKKVVEKPVEIVTEKKTTPAQKRIDGFLNSLR